MVPTTTMPLIEGEDTKTPEHRWTDNENKRIDIDAIIAATAGEKDVEITDLGGMAHESSFASLPKEFIINSMAKE